MLQALPLPVFDLPRAGRALSSLLKNPDDLPQVFTIVESMSGTAIHRLYLGMRVRKSGARLLAKRPDIAPILMDRDALARMPEGSLGRAYLEFVTTEGISPEGIKDASIKGHVADASLETFTYIHHRMRDTHDLWHAATGYKGDLVGELAVLAFTLGQNWNTAIAMIVVAGLLKGLGGGESALVLDAFRRGVRAEWLPALEWEALLPLPLDEVRARLKIEPAPSYKVVRTSELRAEGVLS
jgi:ubiquinone biosynthesis protein COQ4